MVISFDMSIATIHPIYRKIMNQHNSLLDLLDSVSSEMEDQFDKDKKKGYEWAEQTAKVVAEGDDIIYQSEYSQYCGAVDSHLEDLFDMQNMFYKSMLCTVYSYYESIMTLIAKDQNFAGGKPDEVIKNNLYTNFSPELQDDFDYLFNIIKKIRNLLVHNYNGTPHDGQTAAAKAETQRKIGFTMYEVDSYVIEKNYVSMILEKEYHILTAISKELGYHN